MSKKIKYTFSSEMTGTHGLILSEISCGNSVLDIGCASGYLGEYLTSIKHCSVYGIEPDKASYLIAKEKGYISIINSSIEDALEDPALARKFDYVLLADVVEHLVDPEPILGIIRNFLQPGGQLIVSLPNIAHYSIRWQLMLGNWDMTDTGILDRTHLHFYTQPSARALFERNGWRVVKMRPVGDFERWCVKLHLGSIGRTILHKFARLLAVQNIFILEKV